MSQFRLFRPLNARGFSTHIILPVLVVAAIAGIGSYLLGQSHAAALCTPYTYKSGSSGTCVKDIQRIANADCRFAASPRYPCAVLNVDGSYGAKTVAEIKFIQKAEGLSADGVVGPQTWGMFCNYMSSLGKIYGHSNDGYVAAKAAGCAI